MANDHYTGVLLEDMDDKFSILIDGMKAVREEMKQLARQADLEEVQKDVKIIKLAVTTTNDNSRKLEARVARLEATS